jgi:hypothetical protein
MMVVTLLSVTLGFLAWRVFTRGERRTSAAEDFGGFTI